MFNHAQRRERLSAAMEESGLDMLFLQPSSDLEYLTGLPRPNVGNVSYAHGWAYGAFIRPNREPAFILPRMFVEFDLDVDVPGDLTIVSETHDGASVFSALAKSMGTVERLGLGPRVWAETVIQLLPALGNPDPVSAEPIMNTLRRVKSSDEIAAMQRACALVDSTMHNVSKLVRPGISVNELVEAVEHDMKGRGSQRPSFVTHIFTVGLEDSRDSRNSTGLLSLREGEAVLFDFGAMVDGYCSDFGRTIFCGNPSDKYVRAYAAMLAGAEAGRAAAKPGVVASDVNRACRAPIEEAGYGRYFRHRMGHGIGLDVHERPFMSDEERARLEVGMTFTDEPSIIWPGHVGVRIENVLVCEPGGARSLNQFPDAISAVN